VPVLLISISDIPVAMATQHESPDVLCVVFEGICSNVSEELKVQMFNNFRRPGSLGTCASNASINAKHTWF